MHSNAVPLTVILAGCSYAKEIKNEGPEGHLPL